MSRTAEEMTLEQKIGMVLCLRRFQEDDLEFIGELVKMRAVGCVQGPRKRDPKLQKVLEKADGPILYVADMEQGAPGSELPEIPLLALAACDREAYYRSFAKGIVRDAKAGGFNANWGPVLDLVTPDAPEFVHRKLSDDPEEVGRRAAFIADVFRQNHFLSCGKHYPGSSGLNIDTHMAEAASELPEAFIKERNLAPYRYLMERDLLPSIMVGHTIYKNIDPDRPATLSKKVIGIIRGWGYDGLVFSDSFAMMSVLQRFGEDRIYGMAMDAGIDVILPNYRTSVRDSYDLLMKNFREGLFTEERLNEAVRRILAAQRFVSLPPEDPSEFTAEDRANLDLVARDCVTAVTDDGVPAALDREDRERLFVVLTPNGYDPDAEIPEIGTSKWYDPGRVEKRIRKNFPNARIERMPEFSGWEDHERILNLATKYREVVVVTFCYSSAYLGTDGLTRRCEAWINGLQSSGKISAVVHFGNPSALQTIAHVPRRIFGYTVPASQDHAIDVLAGVCEAKGKLPYHLVLQ